MNQLLMIAILCFTLQSYGISKEITWDDDNEDTAKIDTITLVFGGDMMSHMPQVKAAWNASQKRHNYEHWFQFVKSFIDKADCAIANLETPLAGEPYSGYPAFSAPTSFAEDLKKVGFDVLVTANNHAADKGKKGIEKTIAVLDSLQIAHTGSFLDKTKKDSLSPLIITIKGVKIALLSYTYGTNGIPVPKPGIVNLIEHAEIEQDIKKAQSLGAHIIIPVIHWGIEYQINEHISQVKTAKQIAAFGVHAIIGMHPHVIQPLKYMQDTIPVAYSLGNFVSNMRERYKDGGLMVKLSFEIRGGNAKLISTEEYPFWIWKGASKEVQSILGYYMIPENSIDILANNEKAKAMQFFKDTRSILGKK